MSIDGGPAEVWEELDRLRAVEQIAKINFEILGDLLGAVKAVIAKQTPATWYALREAIGKAEGK
jgi:hypothetical protein